MTFLLVTICVVSVYMMVYYRLMVRFYYEKKYDLKESTFAAVFSIPSYKTLDEKGQKYARRYWVALICLITSVLILAVVRDINFQF